MYQHSIKSSNQLVFAIAFLLCTLSCFCFTLIWHTSKSGKCLLQWMCCPVTRLPADILRVPDQNGISQLYNMLEICHSGPEPLICYFFIIKHRREMTCRSGIFVTRWIENNYTHRTTHSVIIGPLEQRLFFPLNKTILPRKKVFINSSKVLLISVNSNTTCFICQFIINKTSFQTFSPLLETYNWNAIIGKDQRYIKADDDIIHKIPDTVTWQHFMYKNTFEYDSLSYICKHFLIQNVNNKCDHTRTHACTHAHTHARTHAHTHTHTHKVSIHKVLSSCHSILPKTWTDRMWLQKCLHEECEQTD